MTKAAQLASVQAGADELGALLAAVHGADYRPKGNGTYGVVFDELHAHQSTDVVDRLLPSRLIGRRVYVSAPWPLQAQARAWRAVLEHAGFVVIARWLDLPADAQADAEGAEMDLEDVVASDVLLLINPPEWAERGTGGRHVELGYALGAGKRLVLFGARTNVFHQLPAVEAYDDVDACLVALEERR